MYAIIETGGKQYKVNEGDVIFIEKLDCQEGDAVTFDKVIAVGKEDGMTIGTPVVEGATVSAKSLKQGKAKKVIDRKSTRLNSSHKTESRMPSSA